MKGVIFTEFLELVDEAFSPATTEAILESCCLASGGAYTAVGRYDPAEMTALVTALSRSSGKPAPELCRVFGHRLLSKFSLDRPDHFARTDLVEFLERLHDTIHPEVLRLYPDAEFPHIHAQRVDASTLHLFYTSPRRLADVAEGLLEAAIAYFRSPTTLTREDLEDREGSQCVRFTLTTRQSKSRCPVASLSAD